MVIKLSYMTYIFLSQSTVTPFYKQKQIMAYKLWQLALLLSFAVFLNAAVCSTNQYLTSDEQCLSCPASCASCSNPDFCTSCVKNSYLVTGLLNVNCRTCSQIFVGCVQCLSNVACSSCRQGFFLSGTTCKTCYSVTPFCIRCASNGANCSQCAYPFILTNGSCINSFVDIITTNSSTNTSSSTSKLITLPNGTQVTPILDSHGCNQNQVYQYLACINKIQHCASYQTSGLCQYCQAGFLVTLFGDCAPNNQVLNCQKGFWLNRKLDKCIKVDESCDAYYPFNGTCYNCSAGYEKNSKGQCVTKAVCSSRSVLYKGICIELTANCASYSPEIVCTSCVPGYSLNNEVCSFSLIPVLGKCRFPCRTCRENQPEYCFSCVNNYQLQNSEYGTCTFHNK